MQRFFNHIFYYYDSSLPIGSDEIIKRLQMWLNNPICGHKEGTLKLAVKDCDGRRPKASLLCGDGQVREDCVCGRG